MTRASFVLLPLPVLFLGLLPGCSCAVENNFGVAAAAGAPQPAAPATYIPEAPPPTPDMIACATDNDCVAVPVNECCSAGDRIAVNTHSVDAYKASFRCPDAGAGCYVAMVPDPRLPRCDEATRRCAMVGR